MLYVVVTTPRPPLSHSPLLHPHLHPHPHFTFIACLSRTLAFEYNWPVVAIESSESNVAEASRIDKSVSKKLRSLRIREGRNAKGTEQSDHQLRHPPPPPSASSPSAVGRARSPSPPTEIAAEPALAGPAPVGAPLRSQPLPSGEEIAVGGSVRHVIAHLASSTTPRQFWATIAQDTPSEAERASHVQLATRLAPAGAAAGGATTSGMGSADAERTLSLSESPRRDSSDGHAASAHRGTSVLVGLHTCGDLAPTMIRVFHHAGRAVSGLVSVGCCYMKLSEPALDMSDDARRMCSVCEPGDGDEPEDGDACVGFPMSHRVRSLGIAVGYHLLEHSCHSLCAYASRLTSAAANGESAILSYQLHGRRAILELLLSRHPQRRDGRASVQVDRLDWRRRCRPTLSDRASRPSRPRDLNLPTLWCRLAQSAAPPRCLSTSTSTRATDDWACRK